MNQNQLNNSHEQRRIDLRIRLYELIRVSPPQLMLSFDDIPELMRQIEKEKRQPLKDITNEIRNH